MRNQLSTNVVATSPVGLTSARLPPATLIPAVSERVDANTPAGQVVAALKAERDRFLALSFCWADTLFELDRDRRIVYATGAIQTLVGHQLPRRSGRPLQRSWRRDGGGDG